MIRIENSMPKLKPGRWETLEGSKVYFKPTHAEEGLSFNEELLPFFKQLDGTKSLSEIQLFLLKKNIVLPMREVLPVLGQMVKYDLLENSSTLTPVFAGFLNNKSSKILTHDELPVPNESGEPHFNKKYFTPEVLEGILKRSPIFHHCDSNSIRTLLKHSQLLEVHRGAKIIKKGDLATDFYIILSGSVGVFADVKNNSKQILAHLKSPKVFGESSALLSHPRTADVVALESGWVLQVHIQEIDRVEDRDPIKDLGSLRTRVGINQVFATNPVFRDIPADVLQLILSKGQLIQMEDQTTVFEQGDVSPWFYFILTGQVMIYRDGSFVKLLTAGDYFGEVGVFKNAPRNAKVITQGKTNLLQVSRDDLFQLMARNFSLSMILEESVEKRLSNEQRQEEFLNDKHPEDTFFKHSLSEEDLLDFDFSEFGHGPEGDF